MTHAVFVAPFFLETTLRFVDAAADVPGVRLGLVSQDPAERLPPGLRAKLAAHETVADGLDAGQIAAAVRRLGERMGGRSAGGGSGIQRLLGTLEELQVPLAEVRRGLGIAGMDVETARNFRDKARMKTVLQAAGLPCARHRLVHSAAEAQAFATEVGYPFVVKPPAGAGARQTYRVDTPAALRQYLGALPPSESSPALLEEFITGEEHSFDSVLVHGRPVWHSISRYFPTPLEVLRNPWIQWVVVLPRDIDGPAWNGIRDVGFRSLQALGMRTGLCHMEWFRRPDGRVAVSEVAARPPGAQFTTLMSWAHEFDLYRAWARLMITDEFTPPERRWAVGAAFLRGQGQGRVRAIQGLDQLQREMGELVVEARLPKPGQSPSGTYEGEGYVIVRHPETAVVEQALRRVVSVIRVELG